MTGIASIRTYKTESLPGSIRIFVHPDHRRKGIGKELLKHSVAEISKTGVSEVLFYTSSSAPAGSLFAEKLELKKEYDYSSNRLTISEADDALLNEWLDYPLGAEQEIFMAVWHNLTPEDRYGDLVCFYQKVHDAEKGQPGFVEYTYTEEKFRQREKAMNKTGSQCLTIICSAADTGEILGMTDISWSPSRPEVVFQGYTAVLPSVRRKGIGKRLKAEMLLHVKKNIPEAVFIRSGNTNYREPILRINEQLGFRCTNTVTVWKKGISALKAVTGGKKNSSI
ncbi:hypothetical protein CSA37_03525 [Candidatus Fermentibacteria bacterium]|nr:MAG: hypothetical protein CSA37_03525 [Candidatus Fermentibacteria bacterium]